MDKRVGLLAGLLVLVLSSGAVAQSSSPEPPPWFGGRVEMPEHGFALTVPNGWVAFDLTTDIASQLKAASDTIDPAVWSVDEADLETWLAASAAAGMQLWLRPVADMDLCLMSTPPYSLASAEDAAQRMYETEVDDPGVRNVERPRRIEISAGPAYLTRLSREDSPGAWWPSAEYWLSADDVVLLVFCTTDAVRPDDDWLSMVESIEFLPAEE